MRRRNGLGRNLGWRLILIGACTVGATAAARADDAGKAPAPSTAPAATQAQHEPTMRFTFINAPVQSVLSEMAKRLGVQIIQTVPIDAKVTIQVPEPVTADEAVQLLNSMLIPMHYAAIDDSIDLPSQSIRILRVMPIKDAMKSAPVGEIKAGM